MMNFEFLREKLKESAAQAAQAAREFEGLDAMAAQDDYIHQEEFNVASKNRWREAQQQQQQQQLQMQQNLPQHMLSNEYVDYHDQDDTSTLSTHSSLVKRVPSSKSNSLDHQIQQTTNQKDYGRSYSLQDIVPLKVNVPDRQLSLPVPQDIETPASSYHDDHVDYYDDDEDDASNSSEEDDPILSLIRKQKVSAATKKTLTAASNASYLPTPPHSQSPHGQRTPKQKQHRFMEDLDSRLAMENMQPPIPSPGVRRSRPVVVALAGESSPPTTTAAAAASWFSGVAAKSMELMGQTSFQQQQSQQHPSQSPAPLLSRARWRPHPTHNDHDDDDELANVAVVSSTAMLDDQEMRELAQLRAATVAAQQQSSLRWSSLLWNVVRDHPRESFIVLTLLLGSYVYFRYGGSF